MVDSPTEILSLPHFHYSGSGFSVDRPEGDTHVDLAQDHHTAEPNGENTMIESRSKFLYTMSDTTISTLRTAQFHYLTTGDSTCLSMSPSDKS